MRFTREIANCRDVRKIIIDALIKSTLKLMTRIFPKILFYIFLLTTLNACVSRIDKHGYMFDLSDHQLLQEGITTKDRVLRIMGSPTLTSDLEGSETWIYFAEDVKSLLFFRPDIKTRTMIAIKFDNSDTIRELKNYDLSDDKKINFASNYTEVKSNKIGFFKSIFGNVGQIRPQ